MKSMIEFKPFNRDKSIDELRYSVTRWLDEFDFVSFELPFLKRMVKAFPFKNIIPNLFEQIQLFIKDLDDFESKKNDIIIKIELHNKQLDGMTECNELSCDHYFLLEHDHLAENIHNYYSDYRALKIKIYNYLLSSNN